MLHALRNIARGGSDAAHCEEDVIVEKVGSERLNLFRESGREHQRLAVFFGRERVLLDNAADLGLKKIDYFSSFFLLIFA